MKKFLIIGLTLLSAIMLSSCTTSSESTANHNNLETQVQLAQNNYRVIGQVRGESKQFYVMGIGGMSPKSLSQSAISDMFNNADLKSGARAIVNVYVTYKNGLYPLCGSRKAIATGTLIEFTK